jgi:hypothetical protein
MPNNIKTDLQSKHLVTATAVWRLPDLIGAFVLLLFSGFFLMLGVGVFRAFVNYMTSPSTNFERQRIEVKRRLKAECKVNFIQQNRSNWVRGKNGSMVFASSWCEDWASAESYKAMRESQPSKSFRM